MKQIRIELMKLRGYCNIFPVHGQLMIAIFNQHK